jgi:hypothetical protein
MPDAADAVMVAAARRRPRCRRRPTGGSTFATAGWRDALAVPALTGELGSRSSRGDRPHVTMFCVIRQGLEGVTAAVALREKRERCRLWRLVHRGSRTLRWERYRRMARSVPESRALGRCSERHA